MRWISVLMLVHMVLGAVFLCTGIWTYLWREKVDIIASVWTVFVPVVLTGGLLFMIGVLGRYALEKKKRKLITCLTIVMLVVFILALVMFYLSVSRYEQYVLDRRENFEKTVGGNSWSGRKALDELGRELACCDPAQKQQKLSGSDLLSASDGPWQAPPGLLSASDRPWQAPTDLSCFQSCLDSLDRYSRLFIRIVNVVSLLVALLELFSLIATYLYLRRTHSTNVCTPMYPALPVNRNRPQLVSRTYYHEDGDKNIFALFFR